MSLTARRALGVLLGVVLGTISLALTSQSGVATDDVVYVEEIPSDRAEAAAYLEELIEANPGKDLILQPGPNDTVIPSDQRQALDAERLAVEQAEMDAKIAAGLEAGVYYYGDPPACQGDAPETSSDGPSRFIICDGTVVARTSTVEFDASLKTADEILTPHLQELFSAISPVEQSRGYATFFDQSDILKSVSLDRGELTIDFHSESIESFRGVHGGRAVVLLELIHNTVFQFSEVDSVALTLDGDCRTIGDELQTGCLVMTREAWASQGNDVPHVERFSLKEGS